MFHILFGVTAFSKKKSDDGELLLICAANSYRAESFTVVKGAGLWLLQLSYSTKRLARSAYKDALEDFFTDSDQRKYFALCYKEVKPRFLVLQDADYGTVAR